jgi:hypothetical protein
MMRYRLSAAIITGVFCLAPGEPARTPGDRIGDYLPSSLPSSDEMTPPAGLYFEDDIYFHDGKTRCGVKLHHDGRRVACNFVSHPWRCPPFDVALS